MCVRGWRGLSRHVLWGSVWLSILAVARMPRVRAEAPGRWALPGFGGVSEALLGDRAWTVAAAAGLGVTDRLRGVRGYEVPEGAHYRAEGALALGGRLLPWLALALRLDGRYDRHPDDAEGADDGWTGAPWLLVRGAWAAGPGRLGAELRWSVPGWEAPDLRFDAAVLEGRLLYTWRRCEGCLALTAALGYRLDGSARVVSDAGQLRPGDLSALEVSEFDAALLGVGARFSSFGGETWVALSAELLLGERAPGLLQQPAVVAFGHRRSLGRALWLLGGFAWRPTAAPFLDPSALAPVRPRARLWLGLALDLAPEPPPRPRSSRASSSIASSSAASPREASRLELLLRDPEGTPVADARVRLVDAGGRLLAEGRSDAEGRVRLELPPDAGDADLAVEVDASEHEPLRIALDAARGQDAIVLKPRIEPGELRGLVRSFSGRPLRASIELHPGAHRVEVDEDGRFELQVPPGVYEVLIEAGGYRSQRRRVTIEQGGVTVLNVELRRGARR